MATEDVRVWTGSSWQSIVGPTRVSSDPGNIARLGSDGLLFTQVSVGNVIGIGTIAVKAVDDYLPKEGGTLKSAGNLTRLVVDHPDRSAVICQSSTSSFQMAAAPDRGAMILRGPSTDIDLQPGSDNSNHWNLRSASDGFFVFTQTSSSLPVYAFHPTKGVVASQIGPDPNFLPTQVGAGVWTSAPNVNVSLFEINYSGSRITGVFPFSQREKPFWEGFNFQSRIADGMGSLVQNQTSRHAYGVISRCTYGASSTLTAFTSFAALADPLPPGRSQPAEVIAFSAERSIFQGRAQNTAFKIDLDDNFGKNFGIFSDGTCPSFFRGTVKAFSGIEFNSLLTPSSNQNTLDDYEEGTWVPGITAVTPPTLSYAAQIGNYVKVGSMVHLWGRVQLNALTATGAGRMSITGLPIPIKAGTYGTGSISTFQGWGSEFPIGLSVAPASPTQAAFVRLNPPVGALATGLEPTNLTPSTMVQFTISYQAGE